MKSQTDENLPGVSCLCLAYGRVSVLEEAIASFLRQTYEGPKELVILNDLDAQKLIFDHPEVKVVNEKRRFATLGEKRNAICAIARYDILFPWDDDDICLGHRLEVSLRLLEPDVSFSKPKTAFMLNDGRITKLERNVFHAQCCFRRALFDDVGGYPRVTKGEDLGFERKFSGRDGVRIEELPPEQNFYLYRWAGVWPHVSGLGLDSDKDETGYDTYEEEIRRRIRDGALPEGDIELKPHWRDDYERLAREFLSQGATSAP